MHLPPSSYSFLRGKRDIKRPKMDIPSRIIKTKCPGPVHSMVLLKNSMITEIKANTNAGYFCIGFFLCQLPYKVFQ